MKTYHMIDKRTRNYADSLREIQIHYTFDELKKYFKPEINNYEDADVFKEMLREWNLIENTFDLYAYLNNEFGIGEQVPFIFMEDEIEDEDARQRANNFLKIAR